VIAHYACSHSILEVFDDMLVLLPGMWDTLKTI